MNGGMMMDEKLDELGLEKKKLNKKNNKCLKAIKRKQKEE